MLKVISVLFALAIVATSSFAAEPDYRRDVEPIFKQYCNGCHSSADKEGKLSLEKFDELLRGGAGGVVVVPGRPELSRLLMVLDGREKPAMPPEGNEAPKADELAVLKRWIEAGAKGPTGAAPDPTILVTPKVKLTAPPRDAVTAVAVSPTAEIAAIGSYGAVRLVGLDDQATTATLSGIRGSVTDVEFSKDGKLVVTAAGEPGVFGEAQLWNTADGKLVRTFTGHRDSLYAAAISPDGKLVATGSYDQLIKIWDAATGKELQTLAGHNGAVFDLTFHPKGRILASAGADRTIKLWDAVKGTRLDTFGQPTKEQFTVAFSPDGKTLVAGGADSRIRVYSISKDAAENTNPLTLTRFAHEGAVMKLAFSTDGKTLVSTGEDRLVRLFNAANVIEKKALDKQSDWVPGVALSADAKKLVVGRMDGTFAVYDAMTGKVVPAAAPELAMGAAPFAVTRGAASSLTLSGKNLRGAEQVEVRNTQGKAIAAKVDFDATARTATQLKVHIAVDAKTPLGSYQLVAIAPAGTSNAATLLVDNLPQVAEAEPNNFAPKTKPTEQNVGYWGVCAMPGDVDHVRFAAKKGETVVCRLEAKSLGSMLNGVLTVLDADGEVAAANNDFDDDSDPLVAYQIPKDGVYAVRIGDQAMNGSDKHFYRLSLGTFPLVTGVFPTNVTVGREAVVQLTGFNLPKDAVATVKPSVAGEVNVPVDLNRFRVAKTPKVRGVMETEIVESEPNDDVKRATKVTLPAFVDGRIYALPLTPGPSPARGEGGQTGADVDLFRFDSKKGQTLIIETEARRRGSPVDTKIEVLDAQGKLVPRILMQAVLDSYITFRSINSNENDCRLFNWREMDLEQFVYISGDVARTFRLPQGPDSGFRFYNSGNKRRGYFDTSPVAHALDEPAYVVEPHPIGTKLINNGLPVFTLHYSNDDDGLRKLGSDSRLTFTAPADGAYFVRVSDVRGFGGDRYFYRLSIREPQPDFMVKLSSASPSVSAGSGTSLTLSVERVDGFDDEIVIDSTELPPGYTLSTPVRIQAGHDEAQVVLNAAADAKPATEADWAKVKLTARAETKGSPLVHDVAGFKMVKLAEKPKLLVTLEPADLTIAPGTMITAKLKIERNGVDERVGFDVLNLPHGVIVDNIGLNGILIPEGQSEREIFLTCYDWVPETDRTFFALSKPARAGDKGVGAEASRPVVLHVRKPSTLVKAEDAKK